MDVHIHATELMIDNWILDHRTKYRVENPDLDVTSQEYEDGVASELKLDNTLLFLKFYKDFLEVKNEEMDKETFDGYFEKEETPYSIKMYLMKKNVILVSRASSVGSAFSDSNQVKYKKDKKSSASAFYELLTKGNYPSAYFHNKTVDLLCNITNDKVTGIVTIACLKDDTNSGDSNVPIEDLLVWRIAVDKKQCDLFVDTDTIKAIFKLASYDKDQDLFSAPLDKFKPRQKHQVKK